MLFLFSRLFVCDRLFHILEPDRISRNLDALIFAQNHFHVFRAVLHKIGSQSVAVQHNHELAVFAGAAKFFDGGICGCRRSHKTNFNRISYLIFLFFIINDAQHIPAILCNGLSDNIAVLACLGRIVITVFCDLLYLFRRDVRQIFDTELGFQPVHVADKIGRTIGFYRVYRCLLLALQRLDLRRQIADLLGKGNFTLADYDLIRAVGFHKLLLCGR